MSDETYTICIHFPNTIVPADLLAWDEDPDDAAKVRLVLKFQGREVVSSDTDYFSALRTIRSSMEQLGGLLECYGASRNVFPSPMIQSMGSGEHAYKLYLQRPARQEDIVSIFASGNDVQPASVEEQAHFYQEWLASLR